MEAELIKRKPKRHHFWVISIAIFLGIFFFLFYTSFYDSGLTGRITGGVIGIGSSNTNLIEIDATITSPEVLQIDGKIGKIDLRIESGKLFVGKESFELDGASIVIDNFDGDITFDNKSITKFNGKASRIFVEGIPITSDSDIRVYFEEEVGYSFLKLNDFYLSSLSYETSGIVKLNGEKAIINLEDEIFRVEKFQGDLEIRGDRFKLKGLVKKSNLGIIDVRGIPEKKEDNESLDG